MDLIIVASPVLFILLVFLFRAIYALLSISDRFLLRHRVTSDSPMTTDVTRFDFTLARDQRALFPSTLFSAASSRRERSVREDDPRGERPREKGVTEFSR